MTASSWLQLAVFLGLLAALALPLGTYLARAYTGEARFAARILAILCYTVTLSIRGGVHGG